MMTGLEPAGGCTVRVNNIAANAVLTANAIAHQSGPANFKNAKPISEHSRWPPIRLRVCENTASGKPNSNTQEAPNEPNIQGWPEYRLNSAIDMIARQEPNQAKQTCRNGGLGGNAAAVVLTDSFRNIYSHAKK